jgi:hypothetical protein
MRLDLKVRPEWGCVDQIREALRDLAAASVELASLADRLSMVGAELLENAIKYGVPIDGGIRLRVDTSDDEVVVAVTSGVDPARGVDALVQHVAQVGADAAGAYQKHVAEAAARGRAGGLGIARVAYEGGCRLETDDSQPGEITVRARAFRSPTPG